MTNRELLREIRKPGRVYVEVLIRGDVRWMQTVKAEIVWHVERDIEAVGPDADAVWQVCGERSDDGSLYLSAGEER